MPTSMCNHISYVIEKIKEEDPKSVLDIGVGFGKWGYLCREYLDIYGKGNVWKKKQWKTKIHGVEIFKPYLDEYKHLYYIYNKIWNCSVNDFKFDHYDCILIMDVAEHLSKEDASALLWRCLENSNMVVLSIPLGDNWLYTWSGDNKYESHISQWFEEELINYIPFKIYYKEHKIYELNKKRKVGVFIYKKL